MAALIPNVLVFFFLPDVKKIRQIGEMLIESDELSCYMVDQNKQSTLHVAVKEGNAALVEVILNHSKDCLEMVDNDGRNALHLAVDNAAQTLCLRELDMV
ncbi:hypothetical protein SUGI_0425310 [Cryptomeria japonica]|nr:hypothetical protein SUGI_0425310 [Cryptomeria japonica]